MKSFDLNSCRSKLEDHYQKTATVPTSVWSKKSVVDIHQIYTRLSWLKEEQTPTGTTQSELKHYTELFTANKNGVIPKRILVQGQTGIGKSTFVKKLLVDWVGVKRGTGDEQAAVLKNFELVVAVNLKEVSKCQSLRDVVTLSNVFAKEDKYMTEGLVDYITNNQEKVLLIFDGYDEYRCGRDSEIYEIFSGNSLRSCSVLLTTRISKADELRGGEDLHAEITGFSKVDRGDFMRRFLNDEEVSKLEDHLYERELEELATVPLLLLFFCILWRKGQSKSFPKSKTKLYMDIIQFILNHSHSKQTAGKTKKAPQFVELKSFKEILSEIGKVALQGLLKDDHLFEYSQLSDSVRCDESVFIGLLQIAEYSETSRPVGMVSFIHKSIQEFLAAWYITYRCIPEGGNLGEIGVKLEQCLALGNVFQFICGLSKDGAFAVYRHLKSVRISDPSLDLSKAIPDVENETDEPLSDVTERQERFRDLVLFLFAEVQESDAELSSSCLDSLGNILLVSHSFPNYLLEKAICTNTGSLVFNGDGRPVQIDFLGSLIGGNLILNKVVKILFTKGSKFLKVAQFLEEFENICGQCSCGFSSVLCFRNGQVFFYITQLELWCENHTRLFTDNVVPPHAVHSTSGQLCLKFLKTLKCYSILQYLSSMESLGAVIKHCNHLERIVCDCFDYENLDSGDSDYDNFDSDDSDDGNFDSDDSDDGNFDSDDSDDGNFDSDDSYAHDSFCHLLEQVPNPGRCSLSIEFCVLTSTGAVKLASLLPRFENVTFLHFSLVKCSTDAVTRLVAAIKHKTLKGLLLEIGEINMMSAVVEVLCQSLPELLALERLKIRTLDGCSLLLYDPVDLDDSYSFPGLDICGLTDSSAEAVRRLIDVANHNFLSELRLEEINPTPAVAEVIVQLLPKLSALQTLGIKSWTECSDEALTRLIEGVNHKTLEGLRLCEMNLTSVVAESLGRLLPELSALETLVLSGSDGCNLQQKEMEAIFGRFSRPSSLRELSITRFSARGSLASLAKNLCYFPCLESLQLQDLDMGEADLCSFLENLKYIPDLRGLYLMDNPLRQAVRLMTPYFLQQKKLKEVWFRQGDASEEDLNYVQEAVREKLPQLRIEVNGLNYSISFPLLHKFRGTQRQFSGKYLFGRRLEI